MCIYTYIHIWNPDHLDEKRCYGTYRYIPVYTGICTKSRLSYLVWGSMNGFTFSPVASWCDVDFQWGCMHAYTPMKNRSFTAVKSEKKIVQMIIWNLALYDIIVFVWYHSLGIWYHNQYHAYDIIVMILTLISMSAIWYHGP